MKELRRLIGKDERDDRDGKETFFGFQSIQIFLIEKIIIIS